jgi:hypothetical protein
MACEPHAAYTSLVELTQVSCKRNNIHVIYVHMWLIVNSVLKYFLKQGVFLHNLEQGMV